MQELKASQLVLLRKASRLKVGEAAKLYAVPVRIWREFERGTVKVPDAAISLLEGIACVRPLPFDLDSYMD